MCDQQSLLSQISGVTVCGISVVALMIGWSYCVCVWLSVRRVQWVSDVYMSVSVCVNMCLSVINVSA